jgi:predicted AlkP superfamily pyrophosphatase or phosphodiesterase
MPKLLRLEYAFLSIAVFLFAPGCKNQRPTPPPPKRVLLPALPIDKGASPKSDRPVRYAVIISIDGLGGEELSPLVEMGRLPTFSYLEQHGSWTREAVCDATDSTTMANHTCMLTGLPSDPPIPNESRISHGYHLNTEPPVNATLHNSGNLALHYIPSIFDVAHDFGLKTCLFSGKSKFVLFSRSYDKDSGKPDQIGADNGTNKIDVTVLPGSANELADQFIAETSSQRPCELTFFHVAELDTVGHTDGWASKTWNAELVRLDGVLQKILSAVKSSPLMKDKTAVIITADHGGVEGGHGDEADKRIFAVPFYVMSPGIKAKTDLYSLFSKTRKKPKNTNPPYASAETPIRGGEVGNFALSLLGLPPIPGSVLYGMSDR